jgi:hypothetical protein
VIKKGDRVFFADNSKGYLERCRTFEATASELGLVPVSYGGVGRIVRDSNVDREIRDDFYGAQAIVLYFGDPKDDGNDYENHWVLPEIECALNSGVPCLVYVSKEFPREVLTRHGYRGEAKSFDELRNDLAGLIEP